MTAGSDSGHRVRVGSELKAPDASEIRAARGRIDGIAIRTPLIRLNFDSDPAEIYLKLENLQPIGSFKVRPAGNAVAALDPTVRQEGVYTASSGNMAQGVAYAARALGVPATVLLPAHAPLVKVDAVERFGATVRPMGDDEWWRVLDDHGDPDQAGTFIHPVAHPDVVAGDATVGAEILEDLPDVDTVVVPFGGGGLMAGVASAMRALSPGVRVLAAESEHCAPLAASLEAGRPLEVPGPPTFITGIGIGRVLEEMWPLVSGLADGAVVSSLDEIVAAMALLFERNRVVAEGAGAAPVAAALAGRAGAGKVVCVISGGNIGAAPFCDVLHGDVPGP
ncbi:threonine ammonia-lyase [Elongatibacter sediminis]|uniref:Threonine/serine dehydratase n=1 Tax=Elongatibacter sediminis TaxID=3119006 RepID=A0AAW9R9V5_9GAMM